MRNILLTIQYDGTDFCGWQRQPNKRSVQGELERILSVLCCVPISINGTSRTDAGVHALGQRASFKGEFGIPADRIAIAANNLLSGEMTRGRSSDIRIVAAEEMPLDFHARFEAKGKKYIYKIRNTADDDIFARNYCYQVKPKLNADSMKRAAEYVVGTHDFKCFEATGGYVRSTTVRTIYGLDINEQTTLSGGRTLDIEIKGDGFLYNMVRIIAGTLVEVGLGKRTPESVKALMEAGDRQLAGHTAPPQGLYLDRVYYDAQQLKL